MAYRVSGLDRSTSGIWRFRRALPAEVRSILGKREWKVSLNTKDREVALVRFATEHKKFEQAVAYARAKLSGKPSAKTNQADEAQALLVLSGIKPKEEEPKRRPGQTFEEYREEVVAWHTNRLDLLDALRDEHIDYDTMRKDYEAGHWGTLGYETPMLKSYDPELVAEVRRLLDGNDGSKVSPTLGNALELYLRTQSFKKPDRSPEKTKKAEDQARGAIKVVGSLFRGDSTKLVDLDRSVIRAGCREAWPNHGTHNKYINLLSAVLNNWNRETGSTIFNPFSGLSNSKLEEKNAAARSSFNPSQWRAYVELLKSDPNREVGLIGLIMAFTGCRTEAASGLEVQDVHLKDEIPFLVFRDNSIRQLDKDSRSRAVPISPELLDALRSYQHPSPKKAAFFPRFGSAKGAQNVSVNLRNRLKKLLGGKVDGLVPYSFRHSLEDKMRASGMSTAHQHYIIGHKNLESTKIHEAYGTMMPPKFLYESLVKAIDQGDWGFLV